MILHPAVLALLTMSLLVSIMVLMAGYSGVLILRSWDIRSGSELQLGLERRTYLISSILGYIFVFQILSLFLYIHTADNLHVLFVGAMCAAGTLNVNTYGYPVFILKILNFLLAGTWLILNYSDARGYDYPLIKPKYTLLLFPYSSDAPGRLFPVQILCRSPCRCHNVMLRQPVQPEFREHHRGYHDVAGPTDSSRVLCCHGCDLCKRELFLSQRQGRLAVLRFKRSYLLNRRRIDDLIHSVFISTSCPPIIAHSVFFRRNMAM